MKISVQLGEGRVVEATLDGRTIKTDQPIDDGGGGTAPSPFDFFLASIATCAGYYVLDFCRSREILVDGVSIEMRGSRNEQSRLFERIEIEIRVPPGFPEKYEKAVVRAAELCSVKKHLEHGLTFNTHLTR